MKRVVKVLIQIKTAQICGVFWQQKLSLFICTEERAGSSLVLVVACLSGETVRRRIP